MFLCVCVCVSVCVCASWYVVSQFDLSITKQNYLSVRCQFLSKSAIMEVELDDGGKHGKTKDGGN